MVDFRRVILALAVLTLFAGLASADVVGGSTQLTCATNVTVTPQLRGEGFTEETGDITIICTGGPTPVAGAIVPLINFTVFYNTNVTSRLVSNSSSSEALLLIDEPGSGLTGDGPLRAQKLCTTPSTGCQATVSTAAQTLANGGVPMSIGTDGTFAANVYQGIVSGNSVTFNGVPVLPPNTTGSRVFRITNVRVNAQPLSGVSSSGGSPVNASISTSPAGALSITNSTPNVGFVSPSLNVSAGNGGNQNQCASVTKAAVSTLTFTENFGTAFKTRIAAQTNNPYSGQTGLTVPGAVPASGGAAPATSQASPGTIYNSESAFVYPIPALSNGMAGLADFGTRLKATFNNLPPGTRIFVSQTNVLNASTPLVLPAGFVVGGRDSQTTPYAQLVSSETVSDGNFTLGSGFLPSLDSSSTTTAAGVTAVEIANSNGTATAVWEVLNTNPNQSESFKFGVYITFVSNVASNIPLPGGSSVTLSYAPTPPLFSAASGAAASSGLSIPRFAAGTLPTPGTIFSIIVCRTVLLYPYLTNQAGFDTGITVANTTTDPFGTAAQSGHCTLNWYGGTTAAPTVPPGIGDTGTIASGTVFANTLQAIAPNFQGYMIAVCNFQFAHGFAFISDVGARNLAMGYLAIVLNDPGTTTGGRSTAATGVPGSTGPEVGAH